MGANVTKKRLSFQFFYKVLTEAKIPCSTTQIIMSDPIDVMPHSDAVSHKGNSRGQSSK